MFAIAAIPVIGWCSNKVQWHSLPIVIALLATVPFIQFGLGMLPFSGQAWVCTAYILGLLLTMLMGARWEAATPGRAADGLFLAVGIASLVSVGLQLRQWLGLEFEVDSMQVWMAEFSPGRPSANLGQPNQLATLLLWGLLASAWGLVRGKIKPFSAVLMAMFILFGIVLTQSRIAFIALLAICLAAWIWRRFLPARSPLVVTLLLLYFAVCTLSLQSLSDLLGLDLQIRSVSLGGASTQLRLKAYSLFLDAAWQHPWWGYGWNQLAVAQLSVAQNHPTLTSFFIHSHNLFLDLVLWCGIPIGGLASLALLGWLLRGLRRVANAEDAILMLFLVAVGLHAMVELPLHHAYLLLPTGLVMGMLNERQRNPVVYASSRWTVLTLLLGTTLLLLAIMRDYLHVDESFRTFRMEAARIGRLPPGKPPNVWLLNDMREFILYARKGVEPDISVADAEKLHDVALSFPTPSNLFNFAKALAYLHKPEEATVWIEKTQKVQPQEFDRDLRAAWESQARTQPAMAAVKWPPLEKEAPLPSVEAASKPGQK
ncbi:O-antigen ligase family protein [Rhodoferax sp.]|uniref:PglL family O-oligosaccharyltransferase n=1 Tax=Rhodoferax sp. TaxID=50421 RepID=UPI0025D267D1|nr:O-antigen ligase family protein [Rhodoferax sp.]